VPIISQTQPLRPELVPQPAQGPFGNHLASLDGLRALSIVMVLVSHGAGAYGRRSNDVLDYFGHLGVSIFFVISGTLITWLMIREKEETGLMSLRSFYIRRALRIIPVFWLFTLCVIALKSAHAVSISNLDILRAFTFTHNYPFGAHAEYAWWMNHTWSLSLEEQFYLVWPGLFALLATKNSRLLAMAIALGGPLLRAANYYLLPSLRGHEGGMFQTRIDILMMGCLAAFVLDSPGWRERIRNLPSGAVLLASSLFLLGIEPYLSTRHIGHTLARAAFSAAMPTIEAAAIAAAILVLVAGRTGMAYAALNQPAVMHIGQLSYGLYLWQQLFLSADAASNVWSLAWRIAAIYIVSLCSFRFVEKPFLRLRKKFRRVPE
jgi:peptidoglycan/LPS O-acetylase OafA/YrhL